LVLLFVYGVAKANWDQYREREARSADDLAVVRGELATVRRAVAANEERLRPKLTFVFDGRCATYYQEAILWRPDNVQVNDPDACCAPSRTPSGFATTIIRDLRPIRPLNRRSLACQ
jgi:hypothetical protein